MAHFWLLRPKFAVISLMALLLLVAVACGSEATPQPTATPQTVLSAEEVAALVSKAVTDAAAAQPKPVSAAEIEQIVKAAIPTPDAMAILEASRSGGHIPQYSVAAAAQWDPHQATSLPSMMSYSAPLYNKLIQYNPETQDASDIRGDLAKSWDVTDGGTTYTFKLHDNVTWWDGKPLTAADVVFSLNRLVEEDQPRRWAGLIKPYYESARAIDDLTVEVKIPFDTSLFLLHLALEVMKVVPKHVLDAGVDISVPENIVGSGPFKFEDYKKDIVYELSRNPNYFKNGRPYIDSIARFIISDRGTIIAAFKTGRVLMTGGLTSSLSLEEALKLKNDMRSNIVMEFHGPSGVRGLNINWTKPPFDDVRVRRALHLALDRQEVVDILSGGVNLIGGPFSPGTWFGRTEDELAQLPGYRQLNGEKHPDDIAEARKLMAEAGFGPNNPLKTTLKTYAVLDYADAMQIVGKQLETYLGAEVDLRPQEVGALFEQVGAGDYDLAVMGQGVLVVDPTSLFNGLYREDAGNNYMNWKSDKIEQVYQDHLNTSDLEERAALVREAADYLINTDAAWINIDWPRRPWIHHSSIKNMHIPAGILDDLMWEHIWCDPSCGG